MEIVNFSTRQEKKDQQQFLSLGIKVHQNFEGSEEKVLLRHIADELVDLLFGALFPSVRIKGDSHNVNNNFYIELTITPHNMLL